MHRLHRKSLPSQPLCCLAQYYITSQSATDCVQGMLFAVAVPADATNALCSTSARGPSASASGTPGGTSTSTSDNSAASASGPPGGMLSTHCTDETASSSIFWRQVFTEEGCGAHSYI